MEHIPCTALSAAQPTPLSEPHETRPQITANYPQVCVVDLGGGPSVAPPRSPVSGPQTSFTAGYRALINNVFKKCVLLTYSVT